MTRRLLAVACASMLLAACGGSSGPGPGSATAPSVDTEAARSGSGLAAFAGENICEVLPVAALQSAFNAPAEVKVEPHASRHQSSCTWSWPRPDAEERQQAAVQAMLRNATRKPGEGVGLDLRALATDFSVSIAIAETRATAASFVPPKLSEDELEERIRQAADAANKRLSEEQRRVLGEGGAEDLAGGMLRKANERVEIAGVGDAAYWLPVMGGSLNVLSGNLQITITPMLADDEAGNIEAAKQVFAAMAH